MTLSSSIWFQLWTYLNQTIQSVTENVTTKEFHMIYTTACLAHHLDITLINENYQLLPNINIDKLLNKMLAYVLIHVDYSTIEILLSTCGSLACLKEFFTISTNNAQTLIAILSLPWMDISNSIFKSLPCYRYFNVIMKKYSTLLGESFYIIKPK